MYLRNYINRTYHFFVMFDSGEHTILTSCVIQFIVLICLSPEQIYLKNLSKEYK